MINNERSQPYVITDPTIKTFIVFVIIMYVREYRVGDLANYTSIVSLPYVLKLNIKKIS